MIKLSKELNEKLDGSSNIIKIAYKLLKQAMIQLISGDCEESEVYELITRLDTDKKNSMNPKDYCSLDDAQRILRFGQNRVGCVNFLKNHNIHSYNFKNMPAGYKISEIEVALKYRNK